MKIAILLIALFVTSAARAQWTLHELLPDGPATAVVQGSVNGHFYGSCRARPPSSTEFSHATLWSPDFAARRDLHPPGVRGSMIWAADSQTQGGSVTLSDFVWHACLWRGSAESFVSLHRLYQFRTSEVRAIDGDHQFGIINTLTSDSPRASMWSGTADSWVSLNPNGATESVCFAASGGVQGGGAVFGGAVHAGLWHGAASTWVDLHPVSRVKSMVRAMADHSQVGSASVPSDDPSQTGGFDTAKHASLWYGTAESWVELHPTGAIESMAYAVAGRWQAGWFGRENAERACVWRGSVGSMVDLHPFFAEKYDRTLATSMWIEGGRLNVLVEASDRIDNRWEFIIASRPLPCGADLDDGSVTDRRDENVDVQDLLFFLQRYEASDRAADIDDGTNEGLPDGSVTLDDLLYFLTRFEAGC